MGTPEKTKKSQSGTSVGGFEDSPVFNFMNNSLSPIKPVKPMHITQAINPLTLASLQSVFTYPHATSLNEPRVIHRHQLSYQSRPEFSSDDWNTVNKNNANVDADNKLDDDREGYLDPTAPTPHELLNEECSDIIAKFLRDSPEHVPEHVTNSYQTSDPAEFSSDELNKVNKNKANVDADNKLDDIIVELFRDSPEHVPEHVTNSYQTSEGNMEGVGIIDQSKVTTPLCSWNDLVSNSSNLSPDPATYFYTSIKPAMQKESKMMESNEKLRVNGGSLIANQCETIDYQHKSGLYRGVGQQRCIVFDKAGPRVTQENDSSQCVLQAAGIGLHSNAPTATPSYYNIPNKHSSFSRRSLIGPGPFASFHHPRASFGQELVCTTLTESKTDKAENGVAQVEDSCRESGYMENITLPSDIGLHSNAPTANPSYYNIPNRDSSFSRRSLIRPGPFASFHHPRASSGQDPICTTLTKRKTDKYENDVARVEDSCQESGYMENITLSSNICLHSNAPTASPSYYNIPKRDSSFSRRSLIRPGPFACFHHPRTSSGQDPICTTLTKSKTDKAENGVARVEDSCQESGYMENITLSSNIGLLSNAPTATPSYYNIPNKDSSFSRRFGPGPFASFHHPRASSGQEPICTTLTESKTDKAENGFARVEDSCQESGYMENVTLPSDIGLHSNAPTATPSYYNIPNKYSSFSGRPLIGPGQFAIFHHPPASFGQELVCTTLTESKTHKAETGVAQVEDSCQKSGYVKNEGINLSGTNKKRRRWEQAGEGERSCRRCSCKKSKCLKLYCECFAAGVYCVEPCACIDCFNKVVHKEIVLSSRKELESRNPLAFAPKVIMGSISSSEVTDYIRKTPASTRHKRGCNCKKSRCLQKYCECYRGGVGCSINCRCEGCKNEHGTKDGSCALSVGRVKRG